MSVLLKEKNEQQLVLTTVSGLPPVLWLKQCKTEDQIKHWVLVQDIYRDIYLELKAYFNGIENTNTSKPERFQKAYKAWSQQYIALYDLIFKAYPEIKKAFQKNNIALALQPGELLCRILELDCQAVFEQCQTYTKMSPPEIYKLMKFSAEAEELAQKSNLNRQQKRELDNFLKKINVLTHPMKDFYMLKNLVDSVGSKSRDMSVKRAYRNYREAVSLAGGSLAYFLHPSKNTQGHQFNKGLLEPLNKTS